MADAKISALTSYTPALDADVLPIVDTANVTTKKITWANIKATLKTYFDTLYTFNLLSPMTTLGDTIYGGASGAGTRLAGNVTTTPLVLTQTGNGSVSAAPVWSVIPTSGTQTYMLIDTASSIGGSYKQMLSLPNYTAGTLGTILTAVGTSATLMGTFASNVGYPNVTVIPTGIFTCHWETEKAAGANNYYTYGEIYKRTAGGTETLIGTTDNSSQTSVNTIVQVTVTAIIASSVSLNSTDRIVLKVYGILLSAGANVTLRYDDSTNSRLEFPSATVDATNFVPYTGATATLDLGVNDFKTTGSIGVTGSRITKIWSTNSESTNMPTVGGTSLSSTFQGLDTQLTSLAALAYGTNGGKFIRVNAGETDFELATISGGGDALTSGGLTQFLGNNNWKVFYSNGSGDVQELALGASGTVLQSNGATSAPSFATVTASAIDYTTPFIFMGA